MKYATKNAVRNFHLPLPDPLYERLRSLAEHLNRPATALAREAIELLLRQEQKLALHEAITDYAAQHAGSDVDLDPQLEAATMEFLLDEDL